MNQHGMLMGWAVKKAVLSENGKGQGRYRGCLPFSGGRKERKGRRWNSTFQWGCGACAVGEQVGDRGNVLTSWQLVMTRPAVAGPLGLAVEVPDCQHYLSKRVHTSKASETYSKLDKTRSKNLEESLITARRRPCISPTVLGKIKSEKKGLIALN